MGNNSEAIKSYSAAIDVGRLPEGHQGGQDRDAMLALVYLNRSVDFSSLGLSEGSIADSTQAIKEFTKLVDANYKEGIEVNLALAYQNRGASYQRLKSYGQAYIDYDQAVKIFSKLNDKASGEEYVEDLADAYLGRADSLLLVEKAKSSLSDYDNAISLYKRLLSKSATDKLYKYLRIAENNRKIAMKEQD